MSSRMKKIFSCFLAICIVLPSMGCTRRLNPAPTLTPVTTWQTHPIPDGAGVITAQCVSDSQILIGISGETPLLGYMDFDGGLELSALPDKYEYINAASVADDGFAVLAGEYPAELVSSNSDAVTGDDFGGELSILLYDESARLTGEIPLIEAYSDEGMDFSFMLCIDGYFLLMSPTYLIRIDADGTERGRIAKGDGTEFSSMCLYAETIIVSRGQIRNPKSQICSLNLEDFILQTEFDLTGSILLGLGASQDGRLLINDAAANSVSYLNILSGEREELFSWDELGLHMPNVTRIAWIGGGYVYFEPNQNTVTIAEYSTEPAEKTELILATTYATSELNKLIYRFNSQSETYCISVVEYPGYGKDTDTLRTEILTGKSPDIYVFSGYNPLRAASSALLFEDLLPYLDADSEYSRETLVPSILTASLREENALRWMPYQFIIFTFTAPISLIGERSVITMAEAEDIAARNDLHVFDIAIYREWLLAMMCNTLIGKYIDLATGTCDFDNPDFIALLEKCNEHPAARPNEPEAMRCLLHYSYLFGFNSYLGLKNYGEDYSFVGLPVSDESGGIIRRDLRFAMSAQSEHKDAVWEFIRSILSSENQQAADWFPVVQSELNLQIEAALTDAFVTASGSVIKLTESDADKLRDIISSTTYFEYDDFVIEDIIAEEAEIYFAGDRTVEETARIIQNRLSNYVSEQQR